MIGLQRSVFVRYGLVIGLIAAAEYLKTHPPTPEFAALHWAFFFVPAVVICAWFGGLGPGLAATIASAVLLGASLVDSVRTPVRFVETIDLLALVVFVVLGLVVSFIAGSTRDTV
jgi:K+-sensing histidine kinase KdpD